MTKSQEIRAKLARIKQLRSDIATLQQQEHDAVIEVYQSVCGWTDKFLMDNEIVTVRAGCGGGPCVYFDPIPMLCQLPDESEMPRDEVGEEIDAWMNP